MISVIIPLYNKEQSVLHTLQSVLAQTYQNYEIVIVDDGSIDKSVEAVKNINDNRIKLYQKENGGVSSARNYGIKKARYDYIAFLDADDLWEPNYLEELVKMITDFPEAGMWGGGHQTIGNFEKEIKKKIVRYRGMLTNYWKFQPIKVYYFTSAIIVRKNVFDIAGYFDERIKHGEDIDMWYRVILNYPVAYNTQVLAYYRQDAENRAMNKEIQMQSFLPYYIEKYAEYRKKNKDFRIYFDHEMLGRLYPYFLKDRKNKDIQRILKHINLSEQKLSYRIKFRFPKIFECYKLLAKNG